MKKKTFLGYEVIERTDCRKMYMINTWWTDPFAKKPIHTKLIILPSKKLPDNITEDVAV